MQHLAYIIYAWFLAIGCAYPTLEKTPAFPNAQGDGAYSVGGRGGKVLVVDRLDDPCPTPECTTEDLADPTKLIPGTLRWALMQPYPRTVVFRVSGTIALLPDKAFLRDGHIVYDRIANIRITSPYLTIAGQTAPAGGISIRNNGITIRATDVVMRYIRFRTGRGGQEQTYDGQQNPETLMIENNAKDVVVDHCSLSWMPAEGLSVYTGELWYGTGTAENITIAWNIIGEGLIRHADGRGHPNAAFMAGFDGDPQYAARHMSLHHNLLLHTQKRNGDLLVHDGRLVNNLIYNWQWLPTVLAGSVKADLIGNIWKPGPMTDYGYDLKRGAVHLVPAALDLAKPDPDGWWYGVPGSPSLYLNDNIYGTVASPRARDKALVCYYQKRNAACDATVNTAWWRSTASPITNGPAITIHPVAEAETAVLAGAGANQRIDEKGRWVNNRDSVDERYIQEYQTTKYSYTAFPWHENDVGGYPTISMGVPYVDKDLDGMADGWELAHGLDPTNASDSATVASGYQSYTWLEVFINGMHPL